MNDFWFTWDNASERTQLWDFLDSGNSFELAAHTKRMEENQYDVGDRINIVVEKKLRATLVLTGAGWKLEPQADHFVLTLGPARMAVQLACTATFSNEN